MTHLKITSETCFITYRNESFSNSDSSIGNASGAAENAVIGAGEEVSLCPDPISATYLLVLLAMTNVTNKAEQ